MTELRDIQKRALAQIRPTGITALGLPTGSGKSILAYAGSDDLRAVVSTPTRALQQQYANDPRIDCFVLMGRTSTHCEDGMGARPPADAGHYCMAARLSGTLHACGEHHCYSSTHQMDGQPMTGCVINVLRGMARDHDFVVVNTALQYWYGQSPTLYDIVYDRDICWVDECHIAVRQVQEAMSWRAGQKLEDRYPYEVAALRDAVICSAPEGKEIWNPKASAGERGAVLPFLQRLIDVVERNPAQRRMDEDQSDDDGPAAEDALIGASAEDFEGFYWELHGQTVVAKPAATEALVSDAILSRYNQGIAMSGTMVYPQDVGLDAWQGVYFDTPGWDRITWQTKAFPKGVKGFHDKQAERFRRIRACVDRHAGQRCLVLVNARYEAEEYALAYPDARLLVQQSPACVDELPRHAERADSVLVSYGGWEGLDLPDDMCRAVIIGKWPIPPASSGRRAKDLEGGKVDGLMASDREVIAKVRQGMGRGIRHADDWCKVYVVDEPTPRYERALKDRRLW